MKSTNLSNIKETHTRQNHRFDDEDRLQSMLLDKECMLGIGLDSPKFNPKGKKGFLIRLVIQCVSPKLFMYTSP